MQSTFKIPRPQVRPISAPAPPKKDNTHIYEPIFSASAPHPPPSLPVARQPRVIFGTDKVTNLSNQTYCSFIGGQEKALVIFYSGMYGISNTLAKAYGSVAGNSRNKNHVFGAVDCTADPALCSSQNISKPPVLKLYSYGMLVSTNQSAEKFNSDQLKMLVTMTPVNNKPKKRR